MKDLTHSRAMPCGLTHSSGSTGNQARHVVGVVVRLKPRIDETIIIVLFKGPWQQWPCLHFKKKKQMNFISRKGISRVSELKNMWSEKGMPALNLWKKIGYSYQSCTSNFTLQRNCSVNYNSYTNKKAFVVTLHWHINIAAGKRSIWKLCPVVLPISF